MTSTLANQAMNYLISGSTPSRMGNAHPNIVPYAVFPCADGWFILAVGNDAQYERFRGLMNLPLDKRFETNSGRVEHRAELTALINSATQTFKRDVCYQLLKKQGFPRGPSIVSTRRLKIHKSCIESSYEMRKIHKEEYLKR